jgi:hypothetical protein
LIYGFLIYENLERIKKEIPYQEPSKRRKLKYLLPTALGTLIFLLIFGFNFMIIFFGRDEPPPYDADLWLSKIETQKEENAFYYLTPYCFGPEREIFLEKYWPEEKERLKEKKEIYLPEEKRDLFREMAEGRKWDQEFAKELIENNQEVFNSFEKIIQSSYYQNPAAQDPREFSFWTIPPSLSCVRDIARLNSIRAAYLLDQGKEKEALGLVIKIVKMGQLIESAPRSTFLEYLVGMATKETGLQRLRLMLPEIKLPPEILRDYVKKVGEFKPSEEGLINAFKMEYASFANYHQKLLLALQGKLSKEEMKLLGLEEFPSREFLKISYYFKPNQTLRFFAEYYRGAIENVNKNYNQMRFIEIRPLEKSKIKMLFTENFIGKMIRDMLAVSYEGTLRKKCEEDFSVIGTQILLAFKIYKIEKGELPKNLNQLIPEYLSEMPIDPFDGQHVRYLPDKKIIYSVGSDLKDNFGEKGDIAFKIEF